jgi:hypothetical protein
MDAYIPNKSFCDFEFIIHIFGKSIDFGKICTRLQQTTQHRYRKVCGIMIGSQWFSFALPSVGGITDIRRTSPEFGYSCVQLSQESDPYLSSLLVHPGLVTCSQEPSSILM